MAQPLVSVILPVYNGEAHIRAAIDSLWAQSFHDFELIVIDDGSTDATSRLITGYADPRLKYVRQPNHGLAAALNRGLALAAGKYIARQDHDDISLPARFEKQVSYLENHPECVLLGTRAEIWRDGRASGRAHNPPLSDAALRFDLLFDNPFVHSSIMMRRDAVRAEGGYCTDPARQPEDYELWSRLARRGAIANLPEALLIYQEIVGSISRVVSFRGRLAMLCGENLAYALGPDAEARDIRDIAALLHRVPANLSLLPRLGRMQALVRKAALKIGGEAQRQALESRVQEINRRLARRWVIYAFNPLRFLRSGKRKNSW